MKSPFDRFPYLTAFVLCFVILLLRGWGRFTGATLWAEDGHIYLEEAYKHSWWSLTFPFAGYYQTLQRFVAVLLAEFAPVAYIPKLICIICYAALAAIIARVARHDYAWLVPSCAARITLTILICFAPGLREMAGNLCNLYPVLFLWLGLLGLKDDEQDFSRLEIALACLVSLSIPTAILFLPLFGARVLSSYRRTGGIRKSSGAVAIVAMALISAVLISQAGTSEFPVSLDLDVYEFLIASIDVLLAPQFILPWLGSFFTARIVQHWIAFAILGWTLGAVALYGVFKKNDKRMTAFFLFELGVMLAPVATWIGRPGTIELFLPKIMGDWFWYVRYGYVPTAAGLILWMSVLRRPWLWRTFAIISVTLAVHRHSQRFNAYGTEHPWETIAPVLDQAIRTGQPEKLVVPIYPPGWTFTYEAPVGKGQ